MHTFASDPDFLSPLPDSRWGMEARSQGDWLGNNSGCLLPQNWGTFEGAIAISSWREGSVVLKRLRQV
jgi:hypothetical protein